MRKWNKDDRVKPYTAKSFLGVTSTRFAFGEVILSKLVNHLQRWLGFFGDIVKPVEIVLFL